MPAFSSPRPEPEQAARDLLWARNRDDAPLQPPHWNPVLETLLAHRSVRAFSPEPLAAGTLELLIAAAQSASSSSNLQTWSVVAVEDAGRKARLSELAANQTFIHEAPLFLVWLADLARIQRLADERQVNLEGLEFLETLFLGIIDAALAAQNAVVALESLGLGGLCRRHPQQARSGGGGAWPAAQGVSGVRALRWPSRSRQAQRHQAAAGAEIGAAPRAIFRRPAFGGDCPL
jgi:hypothetical protein